MKKNIFWIVSISIIIILLLIAIFYGFSNKGTFSIDNELNVTLECDNDTVSKLEEINCNVILNTNSKTILGLKANYIKNDAIEYIAFNDLEKCESDNCFKTVTTTENGFVTANTNGVTGNNIVIGTIKIKINDNAIINNNYDIGLYSIDLCNDKYEVDTIDNNVTKSIKVKDADYLEFDDDLVVDKNIIARLTKSTTFGELKGKINISNSDTITGKTKSEAILSDSDILKTGDSISIQLTNSKPVYFISVLGDVNGDGNVSLADVAKAFQHTEKTKLISENELYYIMAGDVVNDGELKLNDVAKLFQYISGTYPTLN